MFLKNGECSVPVFTPHRSVLEVATPLRGGSAKASPSEPPCFHSALSSSTLFRTPFSNFFDTLYTITSAKDL